MAPGAKIGSLDPRIIAPNAEGAARIAPLAGDIVGLTEARDLGVLDQRIRRGHCNDCEHARRPQWLLQRCDHSGHHEEVVTEEGTVQRNTIPTPRFSKLGLFDQLLHTVASPPVAYLLLLIGLGLLIFEFFTAGVGVAGLVGAVSTLLAGYGIAELPARSWAVALIVLAMVAFAVDVQVGLPRTWTGIGIVLTIIGSLWLFESVPGASLRPTWLSLVAGIGGVILSFTAGMPSMTRTRFATPTIGREWMVGSEGTVVESVDPEGIVNVGGADWRARTNRATPVNAGDTIKVVAIDGITLEVEPLEGAALTTGADGLRVDVQRLDPEMPLPAYAHPGDAGIDLHARESIVIPCGGGRVLMPTGIAIAIPLGWAGFVLPRSGLALRHGLSVVNSPGLIDRPTEAS